MWVEPIIILNKDDTVIRAWRYKSVSGEHFCVLQILLPGERWVNTILPSFEAFGLVETLKKVWTS